MPQNDGVFCRIILLDDNNKNKKIDLVCLVGQTHGCGLFPLLVYYATGGVVGAFYFGNNNYNNCTTIDPTRQPLHARSESILVRTPEIVWIRQWNRATGQRMDWIGNLRQEDPFSVWKSRGFREVLTSSFCQSTRWIRMMRGSVSYQSNGCNGV